MNTGDKSKDEKFTYEEIESAFRVARDNSYLRCMFGDKQLFYMFFAGMKFYENGKPAKSLLDVEDFIKNPDNFRQK